MMRLGIKCNFLDDIGITDDEKYRIVAKMGFDSVDYMLQYDYKHPIWQLSDEELKIKMEGIRKIINENGLVVGQSHSPQDAYWGEYPETKEERFHAQVQAIRAASYLNCPYIVIHPISKPWRLDEATRAEGKRINMEFYEELRPYLIKYKVKGAIENLFSNNPVTRCTCPSICSTAEDLIDFVESAGTDCYTACLDVGHATLAMQNPVDMIYKLGKKYLGVTHIHDNRYSFDDHKMPGMGRIDWYGVGKALNDIGFDGIFNYEAERPFANLGMYKKELMLDYLRVYAELGKAIVSVKN